MKNRRRHKAYTIWRKMNERCYNPRDISYANYGGRGITVCNEWRHDSAAFIEWAIANGWQPGLQIDRIDNDGNYEPGNCRFVTKRQNSKNTRRTVRITIDGETRCLSEWAELFGINYHTAYRRIHTNGWNPESAVKTPARRIMDWRNALA